MVKTLPVMNEAFSPARNATRWATSSACPGRPSGNRLLTSSSSPILRSSSLLAMKPGQIALTRIPTGPSSSAADFTSPITPCLAAEYAADIRTPVSPAADAVTPTEPPPAARIACPAVCRPSSTPRRFTAIVWSHSSSG